MIPFIFFVWFLLSCQVEENFSPREKNSKVASTFLNRTITHYAQRVHLFDPNLPQGADLFLTGKNLIIEDKKVFLMHFPESANLSFQKVKEAFLVFSLRLYERNGGNVLLGFNQTWRPEAQSKILSFPNLNWEEEKAHTFNTQSESFPNPIFFKTRLDVTPWIQNLPEKGSFSLFIKPQDDNTKLEVTHNYPHLLFILEQ